jgi:putative aminopeptidase FrvX
MAGLACVLGTSLMAGALDTNAVRAAATAARSVHLDAAARIAAAESFIDLVRIPGGSGSEHAIRAACQQRLSELGARGVSLEGPWTNAPVNLAMRIDGVGDLARHPALLLNAHLDTLVISTPEHLSFDAATGDFFHAKESEAGFPSSFGGDDRSGVCVVLEALRQVHRSTWTQGRPHPPVLVLLTGSEEIGLRGAKHLARHHPGVFEGVGLSITVDGPLDYETAYPKERLVAVVSEADAGRQPYSGVLGILASHASKAGVGWSRSEVGLGKGDFAAFPSTAPAGLHFRSPVRGWHRRERVQVQDLVHHVDLLVDVIAQWHRAVERGK